MQTIVDVNSVERSYGSTQVINHCSFKIYEGEIYGLLGINGAGKTTLMKMMPQMNTEHFLFTVLTSSFLMGILSSAVGIISTAVG